MPDPFDVFLSHNGEDKPAVERIAERLQRAGLRPWLDKWQLTPGDRWQEELHEGLQACRAFAYFMGPHGEGDWAREELDSARSRAAKDRDFRIFPVLLPGVPDPFDRTTMPPFLGHRTWVDLRAGIDDPRGLQALINAVKGVPLGAPAETEVAPGASDVSPYRGLDAFDEADAEFFFGREPDIQVLVERLKTSRILAVMGPSGSGKSSLVRAGLVPALRRGAIPGSEGWRIEVVKPGARPAEALAARLQALGDTAGMQRTLDGLLGDERTLHLATTLALGEDPTSRLVWVIDQAEELFTLARDDAERASVIRNLVYAASVPGGRTLVVLAMRADFYARAAAFTDLSALISRDQHLVGPLTPDGIRDAIEEPARKVGLSFEEGLIGTILDDLEGEPGSLPLLQYALLELWKRRRGGMLTLEAYRESGGVQGAIAKRAEAIYASFTPEEQAIARRALLRLTQPGEGTEDTRRRAGLRELVTREDEEGEVRAVIGELTDARLLTATADPATGEPLVDISHEALIRAWPRVREWLDEDRAGQRVLRRITEAAAEWQRLGRDDGLLYRGARLAEAVEWRTEHDALLNDEERAFLDASTDLLERERRARERVRRRVTVATGVLAAVFLVLAGIAGLQWLNAEAERRTADEQRVEAERARADADARAQEAEQARAEAETARREALARALWFKAIGSPTQRDRALLLAVEAVRRSDVPDIEAELVHELTAEPRLERFISDLGPGVLWLDAAGDPPRVAWLDALGRLRVVSLDDPSAPVLDVAIDGAQPVTVALSQDGSTVAASSGPTVAAWDVATGEERWRTDVAGPPLVGRMSFVAGDEPILAVAGNDGSVRLLDATDGRFIRQTIPGEVPPASGILAPFAFAFSQDGGRVARVDQDGTFWAWETRDGSAIAGPLVRPGDQNLPGPYSIVDVGFGQVPSEVAILFSDGFGLASLEPPEPEATPGIVGALSTGSSDGLRILMTGGEGGFVFSSAGDGVKYLPFATLTQLIWETVGARPLPYALDATPDGSWLVAGYPDGRVAVYDLGAPSPLAEPLPVPAPPAPLPAAGDGALAIRRDGGAFAWYDGTAGAILVTTATGDAIATIPTTTWVEAVALTDDGARLLAVEDRPEAGTSVGWLVERSLPDGTALAEHRLGPWGYRISVASDGHTVAVGDARGGLRLIDLAGDPSVALWSLPADPERQAITAVELSADGATIRAGELVGSGTATRARLVTVRVPEEAASGPDPVAVDADRISAIATSADGDRVAIGATDARSWARGRLLLMRTAEGAPQIWLGPPGDGFSALRFAPDGSLLSGGATSGWMTWTVDPEDWERRACAIAARDLTPAEWQEALGDEPWAPTCDGPPEVPSRDAGPEPTGAPASAPSDAPGPEASGQTIGP